jgi:hypothetical protein
MVLYIIIDKLVCRSFIRYSSDEWMTVNFCKIQLFLICVTAEIFQSKIYFVLMGKKVTSAKFTICTVCLTCICTNHFFFNNK